MLAAVEVEVDGKGLALGPGLGRGAGGEAAASQATAEKAQAAFVCGLRLLLFFRALKGRANSSPCRTRHS